LSKEDVEKMAKEAEAHADEDKKKKEAVEARNLLDSAVYQAEKLKGEAKDKLSDDDMKTLNEAIDAAKKVSADESDDKDKLEAAAKALNDKLMPIGAKMYESAKADAKPEDGGASGKKDDGPVEGEVVDEDKKE
jgi:molecular chaperone DnaK